MSFSHQIKGIHEANTSALEARPRQEKTVLHLKCEMLRSISACHLLVEVLQMVVLLGTAFTWVLGIWTPVTRFTRQANFPQSCDKTLRHELESRTK